ncbi:FAD-dependent oxidoreductase [Paenibacillus soyae]|uniref:FAD-dependent oxidoreductase n=1 Tax=Paenibacillus soyae TaxID=2969249 RepID=A0A9X2MWV2_9BACL|nr:FAD-dependent oxidoreductase [Paenibacillus soyae]MCR2807895.1 FAD-dependent oxidoreductase [Paenibacillus soyae]
MMAKERWKALAITLLLLALVTGGIMGYVYLERNSTDNKHKHQALLRVESVAEPKTAYDVIVAGTDPEGVAAAVSAARNGLSVLLVDGRGREILGGLMTIGWLNSLDMNKSPEQPRLGKINQLNKGIYQEWFDRIEGTSFDVNTAANEFYRMVKAEPNIDVLMQVQSMEPIVAQGGTAAVIEGLRIVDQSGRTLEISADAVIDATQDADIAAMAGVPYTLGREDLGRPEDRMAVTLVFKMSGVTQEVWDSFAGIGDGTGIDKMSAWGFMKAREYESSNPEKVGIRALNVGRQNDDTVLINAMHIFGIDPLNPDSVKEAIEIGTKEAPLIVDYLRKTYKELANVEYAGVAEELYVRETRHIQGEYRLTAGDVLDNRDFWDAIAYGSYAVDIQRMNHQDRGAIVMAPEQYGVPFRTLVPLAVDNLLVVGRAASFDSIPHGSARVIPLGMATGEAAGAAAKLAQEKSMTFRELSGSKESIAELRKRLTRQGMDLERAKFPLPEYAKHPHYKGLIAAVSMSLAFGGEFNEAFGLDNQATAGQFANIMATVKIVHADHFAGNPYLAIDGMADAGKQPLTLEQLAYTISLTAELEASRENALETLKTSGLLEADTLAMIGDPSQLKVGEMFSLVRDVVKNHAGIVYE